MSTDTAGASEIVFALAWTLGYRCAPRLADLTDHRLWRIDPTADYGPLNGLARQRINTALITSQWDQICRLTASLEARTVTPSAILRSLQRGPNPSSLGRALVELGRVIKTLHVLNYCHDPVYRRAIPAQLLNMVHTLNVVQKLSRAHLSVVPDDRRQRARDKRRTRILQAADSLIEESGIGGITMQRVADRLDCAVGTLYLYFPSKAALIAALQGGAIDTLRFSFETALPVWEGHLADSDLDENLCALVRLTAFGAHWASASVVFADEFHMQRSLLSDSVTIDAVEEVRAVLPVLQRLLSHPEDLLTSAQALQVLGPGDSHERALRWLAALNGVLLLDNLASVDRHLFRAQHLARQLTHDLLCGWGASRSDIEIAAGHVEQLAARGPLAPPPT